MALALFGVCGLSTVTEDERELDSCRVVEEERVVAEEEEDEEKNRSKGIRAATACARRWCLDGRLCLLMALRFLDTGREGDRERERERERKGS